jgi:hypothetical protein
MKKVIRIIPIMIVVATIALWKLQKDYAEIEPQTRLLIAAGAAILSGVISYFLFAFGKSSDKVDPLPPEDKQNNL